MRLVLNAPIELLNTYSSLPQLNVYIGECEEKLTSSHNECNLALAERDAALAERDSMLEEHEGLVAERDGLLSEQESVVTERDNMESDKWDIMKQLREVEDRLVFETSTPFH